MKTWLALALSSVLSVTCTQAKIGHFWHITDFHYDPLYSLHGDTRRHCRRTDERGSSGHHRSLGRFGDYSCDSSLALIESAALHMRTRHPDNVEFVLWTGDSVAGNYGMNSAEERLDALRNVTDLLGRTFSSQFVFPVLGHLDPPASADLAQLWQQWLPTEALITFQDGGYYTIEQSHSKLRIVALNTNLMGARAANAAVALRQWDWLEQVLNKAVQLKEMVYIVGHAPPGSDERHSGETGLAYTPDSNRRYLKTVRKYAKVIAGQFFGHLHSDTFRVVYDNDKPSSWAMVAPSVSPRRSSAGPTNPALRLYKFDTNSGKVLDYTQYYLELSSANRASVAEWQVEYNLTQYYGLHEVTPHTLHGLAEKLRLGSPHETNLFYKYIRANNARLGENAVEMCDSACAHWQYCTITRLDYGEHRRCVESAASALAASAAPAARAPLYRASHTLLAFTILAFR